MVTHKATHIALGTYTKNTAHNLPTTYTAKDLRITKMDNQTEKQTQHNKQPRIHTLRDPTAKHTYTESQTHGLIIEEPSGYSLNTTKDKPNNPEWQTAWQRIIQQEDELFTNLWFYFHFPVHTKERKPGNNIEKH